MDAQQSFLKSCEAANTDIVQQTNKMLTVSECTQDSIRQDSRRAHDGRGDDEDDGRFVALDASRTLRTGQSVVSFAFDQPADRNVVLKTPREGGERPLFFKGFRLPRSLVSWSF